MSDAASRTAGDWRTALETRTGSPLRSTRRVSAGDIGESLRAELDDGTTLFVKRYPGAADGPTGCMTEAEALGLRWLAQAEALRVAHPIAWGEDWLALEWIESAPPARDYDERLGRGLARLHLDGPGGFGLDRDGWLATLPQSNRPHAGWARFYAEERVLPLTRHAAAQGRLPARLQDRLLALCDGMERLVGPPEPPARLHGDLWSGNVLPDAHGHPCLIDPAVYGGHREVDLAMMRLFGGFSRAVFDAYAEEAPLAAGWPQRVPLYQVWPLLAHVCLFGGGYVGRLAECVDAALAGTSGMA